LYYDHQDRFGELSRIRSSPNIKSPNLLKNNARSVLEDHSCTFKPKINTYYKLDSNMTTKIYNKEIEYITDKELITDKKLMVNNQIERL